MKRWLPLFLLALLVPCAEAGVRPLTLAQKCKQSTRILRGTVTASQSRWAGNVIVTDWTVTPSENLKGSGTQPVQICVPGGTIGNQTLRVGEAPRLQVGEDVVLFLRPGSSRCDVYGWFRGKYTIVDGKVREKLNTNAADFLASIRTEVASLEKKGR